MFMDNVSKLEAKVADLEKRIIFLYKMLDKQTEINEKLIKNIGDLQEKLLEYANATNQNTAMINMIGTIMKGEEED